MGMQLGNQGGNGRYQPLAEINVTPFVDVMLVLLIVFMVTAPLLTVGVPVNMPDAQAPSLAEDNKPLEVTIQKDGSIFIQETPVELEVLIPRLTAIAKNDLETRLYVRADEELDYGRVLKVMAAINQAGFTKVALMAELPGRS